MDKRIVTPLALVGLLAVTSCGSSEDLELTEGWERTVNQEAAWEVDGTFDLNSGEVLPGKSDVGTDGLSLRADDADREVAQVDLEAAREAAARTLCERHIGDPWGDDPYSNQKMTVTRVLVEAVWGGVAKGLSAEYIAAARDVSVWVEEHASDTTGVALDSPEWEQAQGERDALHDTRWSEKYPHLLDELQARDERWQQLRDEAYTSENVLAAQELIVSECDFDVPDDYEHPSAADLGIQVNDG